MSKRTRRAGGPGGLMRSASGVSLLAGLLSGLVLGACAEEVTIPQAPEPDGVLVRAAPPEVKDVVDRAELAADLEPLRRAVLAAEVPGRVEALAVEEAQWVKAGQRIAEIDTRSLEQAIAEAEALFHQADTQYQRAERLFAKRSITEKERIDAATGKEVAEVRLASARLQLEKSRIVAPWAGRVAKRHVEVGDYAVPGQPVVDLVDVSRLKVRAPAPASDVPYLRVGAPARIRLDAYPGESFAGRVVRLATELDPQARTLDVEVEIVNPDGRLKPGMLAHMEVPRRTLPQALLIPVDAVIDLGQQQVVYVAEDGFARRRRVELGPVVERQVVVASGLSAADRVIVEGGSTLGDGQRIREAPPQAAATTAAREEGS